MTPRTDVPAATTHQPRAAAEVAEVVRDAAARHAGLRLRGAGRWMEAGCPVDAHEVLSLGAFGGIASYNPDDLTISVGAATTLAELDAATRPHGQWCPLLPWGDDGGTVGATIATATAGPFAAQLGRPRDLVLGIEAVDGLGRVVAAGGRVVKNVAGFDLTRAFTGSWGTLAALTRVHLRLRARPAIDETVALRSSEALADVIRRFSDGPYAPLGAVVLTPGEATAIGLEAEVGALVRVGGNRAFVDASLRALRAQGDANPVSPAVWDTVRRRLAPADRTRSWRWDPLAVRLRERFDPARVLNPGLLGGPA